MYGINFFLKGEGGQEVKLVDGLRLEDEPLEAKKRVKKAQVLITEQDKEMNEAFLRAKERAERGRAVKVLG